MNAIIKYTYKNMTKYLRILLPYISLSLYSSFELYNYKLTNLLKKEMNIDFPLKTSNKENILILTSHLYVGGVENLLDLLIKNFQQFNFVVVVDTFADQSALSFYKWKYLYVLNRSIKDSYKIRFIKKLIDYYHFNKIIITNSLFAYIYLPLLKRERICVFDILHVKEKNNFFLYFSKKYDALIHKHITVSQSLRDYMIRRLKLKQEKIFSISNAVDYIDKFNPNKLRRINNKSKFVISFFGRLYYDKNPMKFLNLAFKLLEKNRHFYFNIVGDGSLKAKMIRKIQSKQLRDFFHFFGIVHNPQEIIVNSDLVVITSRHEGLPFAALESISLGTPVITPVLGSLDELILQGINGYLLVSSSLNSYIDVIMSVYNKRIVFERKIVRESLPEKFRTHYMLNKYRMLLSENEQN